MRGVSGSSLPTASSLQPLDEALRSIRQRLPDLAVLAIHWLHLKHPLQAAQRRILHEDGKAPVRGWLERSVRAAGDVVWAFGRCIAHALYQSGVSIGLRAMLRRETAALRDARVDVIVKTWSFSTARQDEDGDFYYGDLQRRLAHRGVRVLLLCGDAARGNWRAFARAHASADEHPRLPERYFVPSWAPLMMAGRQAIASVRLRLLARRTPDPVGRQACRLASLEVLSPQTTRNGLYYWIAKRVVGHWHPRALITLYEGHAWEKCMWWGAKAADPACRTVGYQHTVILGDDLSLIRPYVDIRARSIPDVVLCLGEVTRQMIQEHERHGAVLLPFGSFRFRAERAHHPADPALRTVLVTPEGLAAEVQAMFAFAAECARRLPTHTFVLRAHPALPMERALRLVDVNLAREPNVILSDRPTIEEDFRRTSLLLYRGSSSVLYAVLGGLRPVYLDLDPLVSSDPLHNLGAWRRACRTSEEFVEIARRHESAPKEDLEQEWRAAAAHVDRYTGPVSESAIDRLLKATGLTVNGPARTTPPGGRAIWRKPEIRVAET